MSESWREFLYPLGYIPTLLFFLRVLVQWITSEVKQKSVVPALFWKISLTGNLLLMLHSFIQIQYHVCVVQACNAIISWRNLDLMQSHQNQIQFRNVLILLGSTIVGTTLAFCLQGYFLLSHSIEWFRIPTTSWHLAQSNINPLWHWFGFAGIILFASRFWVQWWNAEKHKKSYLGPSFWWVALAGDLMCLIYFVRIVDPVNILGYSFGLIPYVRNLMLIRKSEKTQPGAG
jgi:lipid-A-disaccharide synthase-like uncharacterized protein